MKKIYLLFFAFSYLGISNIKAQYTDIYSFSGYDGLNPYGSLIVRGDTIYGMTAYGGAYSAGNVFSIWRNGSHYIDLYDFSFGDGAYPFGALVQSVSGDTLYGMTSYAAGFGNGDIFAIAPNGSWFSDIYDFSGSSGGSAPYGSLLLSVTGDSLWGTTSIGGTSSYGNVFCIETNGSGYYDALDFNSYNGANPYGSLLYNKGYLFGMASQGGYYGFGSIFAINPTTFMSADIYDFDGTAGYPYGSLVAGLTGDTLFGMSSEQGISYGNIFGYVLGGGGYVDLYDFSGTDGYLPEGDLTLARSGTGRDLLYGMTNQGGINGDGNLFSIKTNGSRFTDLFDFSNSTSSGSYPYGGVTFLNDTIYGLCSQGGASNDGVVFDYTILTVGGFKVRNVTCTSMRSGIASAIPEGGVTPYTYLWSPGGQTTQTIIGLSAGSYTVIVTDNVGSHAASVAIISGVSVFIRNLIDVNCNGGSNGQILAGLSGGTAPYQFSWSNGVLGSMDRGLSAGTYTVTVTDSCGMTATASATITQPTLLSVTDTTLVNVYCNGDSTGIASATVTGGITPYTYLWSDPDSQTTTTATGLSAGVYSITVTDNNGCTAIDTTIVKQSGSKHLGATIEGARSVACHGDFDGMALALGSGGVPPFTYLWSPGGNTNSLATGLSAATYTVEVTDSRGCIAYASTNITEPTVLAVSDTTILSLTYAFPSGGTPPYSYSWTPGGSTMTLITGISAGTYTVTITDANGCKDSTLVSLKNPIVIPPDSTLRYPRWSKRGVYVEFADAYYYPADSLAIKGGDLADYCFRNHITYVLLDGVYYDAVLVPYGAFNIDDATVDPTYGAALQSLVYMLKTRGHVEEVGVDCYPSDIGLHDTGNYAVANFDVNNFVNAVHTYNVGLPRYYKIDILSLDEEFWGDGTYSSDSTDFYSAHLPMLVSMYKAAHECDANFLRVEDYIAPPLNNYDASPNTTQSREIDSICKYSDRILFSSYTSYPSVLWDRNDWVPGYQEIGRNPGNYYYKKEIWPTFDAANTNTAHACDTCYDIEGSPQDYLGDSTCILNTTSVDMEQRWYYQHFAYSMEHQIWTPNNTSRIPMGGDTNFEMLGSMWYQYRCLRKICHFDTLTYPSATDTVLPIWVTVGADTEWHSTPIVLTATVHGGTGPYIYIWYNDANGAAMSTAALRIQNYDTLTVYAPARIRVFVVDAQDSTAIDYLNVYNDTCYYPTAVPTIPSPTYVVSVYPNPANTILNVEMAGNVGKDNFIELYDLLGQKVQSDELLGRRTTISVTSLSQAVYFYRITNREGDIWSSGKFVIVH